MKKEFRVLKNHEFSAIIQKRKFIKTSSFVVYYMGRKEEHSRVGISVGKKLGNAVCRNRIKRQVRAMVDQIFDFHESFDVIVLVRPVYLKQSFEQNLAELKSAKERIEKRLGKETK